MGGDLRWRHWLGIPRDGFYGEVVTGRESRGSQVRRSELRSRFQLSGSWGSTPARSCSQRWGSLAAGRTRRSGGVGGVQAGPWGRLERGCVLGGRSSGVYSRRLGKGSLAGKVRGRLTLRIGVSGLSASASPAPSLSSLTWSNPSRPDSASHLPSHQVPPHLLYPGPV